MSCSEKLESSGGMAKSMISRYAIVPIFRGRTKRAVSDRIVAALRKSSFCSSNSLLKKLLVHNVHVYCIVVETSGSESIRIICASVPYLLSLLSRASPKLKSILEDENVTSYLKFFQETDLESLLTSVCAATVIIQKGAKMCYPTLCIQLSRDALMFGDFTLKSLLSIFYNALLASFHFVWEDLGPSLKLMCSHHREAVKYLTKNLPVFALATAKGLILFSLCVRRVIREILRTFRQLVKHFLRVLHDSSLDSTVLFALEQLQAILKRLIILFISGSTYRHCKHVCAATTTFCKTCAEKIIPILSREISNFATSSLPTVKRINRYLIESAPKAYLWLKDNITNLINFCYNSMPTVVLFLKQIKPFCYKLIPKILNLGTLILNAGRSSFPYCRELYLCLLRCLIDCFISTIKCVQFMGQSLHILFQCIHKTYPLLEKSISDELNIIHVVLKLFRKLCKEVLRIMRNIFSEVRKATWSFYSEIYPQIIPAVYEVSSTLNLASQEIVNKSFSGIKRVLPSLWHGLTIASPITIHATQEILVTSKHTAIVLCPSVVDAVLAIQPDLLKGVQVLLEDSNNALVEISTVSFSASCQLGIAAKNLTYALPTVINGVHVVTLDTSSAITELFSKSSKARSRVIRDLKKGHTLVHASYRAAESELKKTLDELLIELNTIAAESPEIVHIYSVLAKEVNVLTANLKDAVLHILHEVMAHNLNSLSNLYAALKIFSEKFKLYLSNRLQYMFKIMVETLNSPELQETIQVTLSSISKCINEYICTFSEHLCNTTPKLWTLFKRAMSVFWDSLCDVSSQMWISVELLSSKIWCSMYENTPYLWSTFKQHSEIFWEMTCEASPTVWKWTTYTVPVLWSTNRQFIRCTWNFFLQSCSQTWESVVPMSSDSWTCALNNCPELWLSVSENSKLRWEMFCGAVEDRWEAIAETFFSSWEILHKVISKTWHYGLKHMAVSGCCNTGSILANSVKFSYTVCAKTGETVVFLHDELSGKKLPFFSVIVLPSKFEENVTNTCDIFKKCIDYSPAKLLKRGTKRKLLYSAIKKLSGASFQVAETYLNYLKMDQFIHNAKTVSKIPFLPAIYTYTLGIKLVKKCYSLSDFSEGVQIPNNEIFLLI